MRLASVQAWCESRRTTLTAASKTAKFSMGEVRWRKRPPKVLVRGKDAVIQALQTAGLERATSTYRSAGRDLGDASPAQDGDGEFSALMHGRLSRGDPARAQRCPRSRASRSGVRARSSWCVSLGRVCEGGMSRVSTALTSAGVRLSAGRCDSVRLLTAQRDTTG